MTVDITRTRNTNTAALIPIGIALNSTTSTTIVSENERRIFFHVNNDAENVRIWIKLQAASEDDDKKGITIRRFTDRGDHFWEMPTDNIYTGEISAIAESGTPIVYVTEY